MRSNCTTSCLICNEPKHEITYNVDKSAQGHDCKEHTFYTGLGSGLPHLTVAICRSCMALDSDPPGAAAVPSPTADTDPHMEVCSCDFRYVEMQDQNTSRKPGRKQRWLQWMARTTTRRYLPASQAPALSVSIRPAPRCWAPWSASFDPLLPSRLWTWASPSHPPPSPAPSFWCLFPWSPHLDLVSYALQALAWTVFRAAPHRSLCLALPSASPCISSLRCYFSPSVDSEVYYCSR